MEVDASNAITYYVSIPLEYKHELMAIRTWPDLEAANDGEILWFRGMTSDQVGSVDIQSLTHRRIYRLNQGKLFLIGNLLPEFEEPNLNWTALSELLKVSRPEYNNNFIELTQKIRFRLEPATQEVPPEVIRVEIDLLSDYMADVPEVRLTPLLWTVIGNEALVTGKPVPTIKGQSYWFDGAFFVPSGFVLKPELLRNKLAGVINPERSWHVFWNEDGTYFKVRQSDFRPLSRSSFRLTKSKLET